MTKMTKMIKWEIEQVEWEADGVCFPSEVYEFDVNGVSFASIEPNLDTVGLYDVSVWGQDDKVVKESELIKARFDIMMFVEKWILDESAIQGWDFDGRYYHFLHNDTVVSYLREGHDDCLVNMVSMVECTKHYPIKGAYSPITKKEIEDSFNSWLSETREWLKDNKWDGKST